MNDGSNGENELGMLCYKVHVLRVKQSNFMGNELRLLINAY